MDNFVYSGDVIPLTVAQAVTAGSGVLVGSIFGVATHGIGPAGGQVECQVVGVFELSKVQAQAWVQGALVYWDQAQSLVTNVAAGNTKIGVAIEPAANPSQTGVVRLNGAF
jgi:predicted RecA/RadA family phage recombinase